MPLELRKERDGSLRRIWYGRYAANGRRYCDNLGVAVRGSPPASLSLRDRGDDAFEASRAAALRELTERMDRARHKRQATELVERLYEIQTGEPVRAVALDAIADEWARIPRRRPTAERYAAQCRSVLKRFVEFVHAVAPKATELVHVSRDTARAFMAAEDKRGVSAKTWNDTLKLLRAVCKHLNPAGGINPFSDMPTRDTDTVFRHPFSPAELKAIVEAAHNDDFIRPIIITGMCTAMRRGDCCLLRWRDVDMERRFISVKTSKTGVTVSIPIFPLLYAELSRLKRDDAYVFPQQARMYLENPDGITWRVQKVLVEALAEQRAGADAPAPVSSPAVTAEKVRQYLAGLPPSAKTARMQQVFDLYAGGKGLSAIAKESGVSKGSVYGYLCELQGETGCRVFRGHANRPTVTSSVKADRGLLREKHAHGTSLRRASVRDFHSFRVTWVTLALAAGVPIELVTRVTGHKTTDIVLKHYFQPGREDFRRALESAMPALLSNGQTPAPAAVADTSTNAKAEALALIDSLKGRLTARDKARLQELLGKIG